MEFIILALSFALVFSPRGNSVPVSPIHCYGYSAVFSSWRPHTYLLSYSYFLFFFVHVRRLFEVDDDNNHAGRSACWPKMPCCSCWVHGSEEHVFKGLVIRSVTRGRPGQWLMLLTGHLGSASRAYLALFGNLAVVPTHTPFSNYAWPPALCRGFSQICSLCNW